jgi:hypothetical protein
MRLSGVITAISNSSTKRGNPQSQQAWLLSKCSLRSSYSCGGVDEWSITRTVADRLQERYRRTRATNPSRWISFLGFIQQTRRPFEWLVFVGCWFGFSQAKRNIRWINLLMHLIYLDAWGSLAVSTINSLAGSENCKRVNENSTQNGGVTSKVTSADWPDGCRIWTHLGARSAASGRGTIYSLGIFRLLVRWHIPVVIVIVRWLAQTSSSNASTLFDEKKAFEQWIVAKPVGWKSFPLAPHRPAPTLLHTV